MTKYQTTVTVPASGGANRIRLSTALLSAYSSTFTSYGYTEDYFPCAKLFLQMATSSTGVGFVGDSTVTQTGTGGAIQLQPATSATVPGASFTYESKLDTNNVNLGDFYIHGTVSGDVMIVWVTEA